MAKKVDVFFAYPSNPPSLDETITAAIDELSADREVRQASIRFKPWNNISVTGKRIITEIIETMGRSDIFACDLTYPNLNVAFELGCAIGKFKQVWMTLDTTIRNAQREYPRFYPAIAAVGYAPYQNHHELAEKFLFDRPWKKIDEHLLGDYYRAPLRRPELPTLLHVKPSSKTDAVVATAEFLERSIFCDSILTDDPIENPSPTLEWYAENIRLADAVIVHLLGEDRHDHLAQNVRTSFVAGLAYGLQKPIIMLAHSPFDPPIDYRHLLVVHQTAKNCREHIARWVDDLKLPRRRRRRPEGRTETGVLDIRNLSIGDHMAENEHLHLDEYFVETHAYYQALNAQTSIFVGRRGTGKTANFIALQRALGADKRNHVCTVNPAGYEVDGLIRLLQEDLHSAERGYLIESLWKFLIYSELARSVFDEISGRPGYQVLTPDETKLVEYVETHSDIIRSPFSQRLDRAVRSLVGVAGLSDREQQRARISEKLHVRELRDLRQLLGSVLNNRSRVAILIDKLDDNWRTVHDIDSLSRLLLGLLRLGQDISADFQHQDYWRKRVNVSTTMFIRSDIFAHIEALAPEQDKLPLQRIVWDDRDLLLRVLDERLKHTVPTDYDIREIWEKLFPKEVVGLPTRDFIISNAMPRPRHVIYFLKEAIAGAINRGDDVVTPEDFLDARKKYSNFVFTAVLDEDDPRKGKLEAILFEFAGCPKTMSRADVASRIAKAGVEGPDAEFYVDLLCDINFLGIQTTTGFTFASDEKERRLLRSVARRLAVEKGWGEESYQVNAAFYQVLQID